MARPSQESTREMLPASGRLSESKDTAAQTEENTPLRHPGQQLAYIPPEYGDEDDGRTWRYTNPYPHRTASRATRGPEHYYGHDPYYPQPYRRTLTNRPPPPRSSVAPRTPKRQPHLVFENMEDEEPETPRKSASLPPDEMMRLPFTMWMNSSAKNHFVATIGEFVGTTMFLFFAFAGTQVGNIGSSSASSTTTNGTTGYSQEVLLYIAISFGFSLMVNVWIFFRISGGLFNPAVTIAMLLTKAINRTRALLLFGAQLAGSIFASYIVKVLFPTGFNVRTTLSTNTSAVQGVFIEMILTAELVFSIFMLAKEKHKATFMAPIGIGLALFVAELVGVYYTGGSLNPARSFGPCVISGQWGSQQWIYWVGPGAGALVAVVFYKFIKILEYEVANPGQDASAEARQAEDAEQNPKGEV